MQTAASFSLGTDDNPDAIPLSIIVPEDGARIVEAGLTITTAGGASAATFTFVVEERNSTIALTDTSAVFNSDEPQFTVLTVAGPAGGGGGIAATAKGTVIAFNLQYSAATGASAAVATAWVKWQM